VIRVGIVGSNFGRNVLLPAFRADRRCEVVALAGGDPAKTRERASEAGIARAFANWSELVDDKDIDAVAIATPPQLQPDIAIRALKKGKAVFAEKPLAAHLEQADELRKQAKKSARPFMVDFEFPELPAWKRAKTLLDAGTIGALRHVFVSWNVENYATQQRLKSWKTDSDAGGGALGNLVSHCFYYLENFCGPLENLSAQIFGLPGEKRASESSVVLSGSFVSGAGLGLTMSQASYLGSGHRIEFYGEDGTLALINSTSDYMRGFELMHTQRPAKTLERIVVADPDDGRYPDGRIMPVASLAARFLDAIEQGTPARPGIEEGYRVQQLIEFARLSHDVSESVMVNE